MSPHVSLWSYGKGSYIIRAEIISSNPYVVKMSVIFVLDKMQGILKNN